MEVQQRHGTVNAEVIDGVRVRYDCLMIDGVRVRYDCLMIASIKTVTWGGEALLW